MASFKFSSLYLFIILLIVLVISVFIGYNMNMKEGLTSPTSTPISSDNFQAIPAGLFAPYPSMALYPIYVNTRPSSSLIILFDPTNGNTIVTDNIATTTNFVMIDRYGETNEYSASSIITPTPPKIDPSVKIGWTYENQNVSISYVTFQSYTYIYVIDHNSSTPTVAIYRAETTPTSTVVQEIAPASQNIQSLNLSDTTTPQSLESAVEKMSNTELKVTPGTSSISSTKDYYVIVSIPPNSSNKMICLISRSDYTLVSVNRMAGPMTSPMTSPITSPMPSNLGSLDTLIFALADIAGTYSKNLREQDSMPSKLSGFDNSKTGLGNEFNPANSNYILKSEIVPPVCPQCPSCGISGCPLSINSSGQIVDCNGNVISNFGATPTTSSSSSSSAPSSIGGVINNTISTTGNVADTAITSTTGAASDIVGTAGTTVSNVGSSVGTAAADIASTAGSTVSGLGKDVTNIVGGLGQDVTTLGTAAIGAATNVTNNAIDSATSLASTTPPSSSTVSPTVPYTYGYPSYGYYGNYPYTGYGGYGGYGYQIQPPPTCSQQSSYLPITNDFSAFGR